tara:strand:- start:2707 stop:3546 length:840 start_codon:yes stop_codon:yes gene_type:complete
LLARLDHLVITVTDLPSAIEDYSKLLGFKPTWIGEHAQLGTINALFPFENTYLELLAAKGDGIGAEMIKQTLKNNGEGLSGLVLGTDDIEGFRNNLLNKGIEANDLISGEGDDFESNKKRTWKNLFLPFSLTRGLFVFIIEHISGSLPNIKKNDSQINRLDHVVVNTNDAEGFVNLYKGIFEINLRLDQFVEKWGGRMLFFRLNRTTIEVIGKDNKDEDPKDTLWGLAWTVKDLSKTHERLSLEGVDVTPIKKGRKPKTLVCTVKSHTKGVPTLLIQHL